MPRRAIPGNTHRIHGSYLAHLSNMNGEKLPCVCPRLMWVTRVPTLISYFPSRALGGSEKGRDAPLFSAAQQAEIFYNTGIYDHAPDPFP
jgi:hypothetical protein